MDAVAEITGVGEVMGRFAASFDPAVLLPTDAARVMREAARLENMAATVKALAAKRAADGAEWRRAGHRSSAEWVARETGTSVGQARAQLDTVERLVRLAVTGEAARAGALSAAQAAAIADAAAADPGAEVRLLAVAEREPLGELRDACRRAKAAADPNPEATHRRIHAARHLREFTDGEGAWNLHVRNTPEVGALVRSTLAPLIEEQFTAARRDGRREAHDAYAADALTELCRRHSSGAETATKPKVRHLALLRIDVEALTRGAVERDETCEIAGIGPIPVGRARELLGESILELVVTRGRDVATVVHLGRGPSAAQKIALLWSQPLCSREGCPHRARLEYDHRTPWPQCRNTTLDNLDALCPHDHDLKTTKGWELVHGRGRRPFVAPDDPRHPRFWHNANDPPDRKAG